MRTAQASVPLPANTSELGDEVYPCVPLILYGVAKLVICHPASSAPVSKLADAKGMSTQMPLWQESLLQLWPSSHSVPSGLFTTAHCPLWQVASARHCPSAQVLPSFTASISHLPLAGWQVFLMQTVSAAVGQVMTEVGSSTHLCGMIAVSQTSVPLHKSPSSLLAQSGVV